MKKILIMAIAGALLLAFFEGAFQMGRAAGFKMGSEWALVQADILAREAGVFMPVYMDDDNFRIVLKQPRGLYKKAWELADKHEEARDAVRMEKQKNSGEKVASNNEI